MKRWPYETVVKADTSKWKGMHQGDKKPKGFGKKKRAQATTGGAEE